MANSNLPATANNALTFSTAYPADKFNVLVPIQTVTDIAEIQKPVMNAVTISTDYNDGEIYSQRGKPALTRKGLLKLMRAAGIRIISTEKVLPSTCQKCKEVNQAIGKPVNCYRCGNKDVAVTVTVLAPQLTGQDIMYRCTREIIVDDVTADMKEGEKKQFMQFRAEHAESKALNRCIRAALMLKPTYTLEELRKPFVVAYLVPNLNNSDVKARAIDGFFAGAETLYGRGERTSGQPKVVDLTNEDDDDYAPPAASGGYALPQGSPEPEQPDYPDEEPDFLHDDPKPDSEPCCDMCGAAISEKVYNYSIDKFGKPLCYNCQRKARGQQ